MGSNRASSEMGWLEGTREQWETPVRLPKQLICWMDLIPKVLERQVVKWGAQLLEVLQAGFLTSVLGSLRCLQKCRKLEVVL